MAVFRLVRYRWLQAGIFNFLTASERYSASLVAYAAWDEFYERITDESDSSPLAGSIDSFVVMYNHDL